MTDSSESAACFFAFTTVIFLVLFLGFTINSTFDYSITEGDFIKLNGGVYQCKKILEDEKKWQGNQVLMFGKR